MPNPKYLLLLTITFFLLAYSNAKCQLALPGLFRPNFRYTAEVVQNTNSNYKVGYRQSSFQATVPVYSKLGVEFDATKLWDGNLWQSLKNFDKNITASLDMKAAQIFVTGDFNVRNPTDNFHYADASSTNVSEHQYFGNLGIAGLYQTKGLKFNFWNVNFGYNTLPAIRDANLFTFRGMFIHARVKHFKNIFYFGGFARYGSDDRFFAAPIVGYYGNVFGKISYGFTLPVETFVQYRFNKKIALGTNVYLHGFNVFNTVQYCTGDSVTFCYDKPFTQVLNNTTLRLAIIARLNLGKHLRISPQIGFIPFWRNHFYKENKINYQGFYGRLTLNYSFGNALLRPEFIPVLGE